MRVGCAALPSHSEYRVPDSGRSSAVDTQSSQPELSFAYAVHQFNAGDRDRRVAELLEPQHDRNALLDAAMVLFNQVIEVLDWSQLTAFGKMSFRFQCCQGFGIRRVFIDVDQHYDHLADVIDQGRR